MLHVEILFLEDAVQLLGFLQQGSVLLSEFLQTVVDFLGLQLQVLGSQVGLLVLVEFVLCLVAIVEYLLFVRKHFVVEFLLLLMCFKEEFDFEEALVSVDVFADQQLDLLLSDLVLLGTLEIFGFLDVELVAPVVSVTLDDLDQVLVDLPHFFVLVANDQAALLDVFEAAALGFELDRLVFVLAVDHVSDVHDLQHLAEDVVEYPALVVQNRLVVQVAGQVDQSVDFLSPRLLLLVHSGNLGQTLLLDAHDLAVLGFDFPFLLGLFQKEVKEE